MLRLASFTTRQLTNIGIKPIPLSDSFTVANYYDSQYQYDLYGAESASAYYGAFGPLVSDRIYFIYKYVDRSSNAANNSTNNITWLGMIDGTYADFTVVTGCIDGDLIGYTRLFTIGGTDYEFYWDGYQYANVNLPLDFEQLVGQTFSLVYNTAIQIPVTPNTMLVASWAYPGDSQNTVIYGANIDTGSQLFGRITNSAFKTISYSHSDMNNYFNIWLKDGTYDGFTVSGGAIDGDTSNNNGSRSTRAFTINGQVRSLEFTNGQYAYFVYDQSDTDIFNLVSLVGQTVSLLYDPAGQTGANGTTASGTLVVGQSPYGQGYGVYPSGGGSGYGSIIIEPPFIYELNYSTMGGPSNNTTATVFVGTYGGVVVDSTGIDGKTSISMTVDGVTQTGTLQSMGGQALLVEFTGDAFGFMNKVGQTLSVSFTASAAAGGSDVTYNEGSDTFLGTQAPPYARSRITSTDFTLVLNSSPSQTFVSAMNALTTGSRLTITDQQYGTQTVTLASAFSPPFSGMGNEQKMASLTTNPWNNDLNSITSIVVLASSGGAPVTVTLSTSMHFTGYYNFQQGSDYFSPGHTSGRFYFASSSDVTAFVSAAPTTITFNDPYSNNTWELTGVSGITAQSPTEVVATWTTVNITGMATSGTASLTYTSASSGGGTATYTSGTDYGAGTMGPPGIYISGPSNPYMMIVDTTQWTNSAGGTAFVALTSGSTFTATMPMTSSTVYTITLAGSWNDMGGGVKMVSITSDTSLPTQFGGSNNVPSTVTFTSGGSSGGGGSSNTFTQSGNWDYANWASYGSLSMNLSMNASSAFIAKLNSTQDNVTSITLVDNQYGSTTFTVQHISGLPVTTGSYLSMYTPSTPNGVSWNQITSITFN